MTINDKKAKRRILYISLSAATGGFLFGFDTAVISGAIDLVKTHFSLSTLIEGWFVSSGLLGCMLGVLLAGLLADWIGRKPVLLICGLLFLLSAVGCSLAPAIQWLIIFRLIGGIGVGVASVISPMYITEFAPAETRGRLVALYQLSITLGILVAYFSNAFLLSHAHSTFSNLTMFANEHIWRMMFLVMALPALIFIILNRFIPESIRWLLTKNKEAQALQVCTKIFGLEEAPKKLAEWQHNRSHQTTQASSLFRKSLRKPLIIGILLCVFQQFCGINAIIYYGPQIFSAAGLAGANALQAQVIIGVVNVLFTAVAIRYADQFGRKPLLIIGLIGMIISLTLIGFCFHLMIKSAMLLLMGLMVFIACFALSVGPITWIIINEIFPNEFRVKGVAICTFALWIAVWLVGQFFPWLMENVGTAGVFWCFACFSLLELIFCALSIKETKGKTLEELEDLFTTTP